MDAQAKQIVLMAGGGIGGLAASLALAQAGFKVRVYEAATEMAEAGAGIQIGANGVKALRALGLEAAATARASKPVALELRLPGTGRVVSRVALGAAHVERYGAPYFHFHRADLHAVLQDAVRAAPDIELKTGCRVMRVTHARGAAGLTFADGTEDEGDAVIGADGIRSAVREGVAGQDEPRFTGMMAWRALVPARPDELAKPAVTTVWMGQGRHLVTYPLIPRRVINLVGVVERSDWTSESWTEPGEVADMQADFAGWHDEIDALLARVEMPWRWALYERLPLSTWCAGRAALLGDACHAMPPFLAQGASMALEDAVVLARSLKARPDDWTKALRDYSLARRHRTERVQKASWANAWRFHLKHPAMRFAVYGALEALSSLAPSRPMRMYDWLYGHDPSMM